MSDLKKSTFLMRTGGFGQFPKGKVGGPEAYLGPPPPETELDLVGAWVSGEPWNQTGYGLRFDMGQGLTEQEMMDMEISYSNSGETIRRSMEFPSIKADPEAADAFKVMSPLLKPSADAPATPDVKDLVSGFAASMGEVIRTYAPKHAIAIGTGKGEFVAGPKLGPALQAFAVLLVKTLEVAADAPDLPASEGVGAFFVAPNRAIDLRTLFDRAAFRTLMMGETVPRALGVTMFEIRHALDERLAGERLSAQESWDAMMKDPSAYFTSPDRAMVGQLGAEIAAARKPAPAAPAPVAAPAAQPHVQGDQPPADLWGDGGDDEFDPFDNDDPSSFGL